jgi:putative ABC transport system substrate-binding protein
MRRRDFINLLGGAAAAYWHAPLTSVHAQQPQPPLIGIFNAASAAATAPYYEAFRGSMRSLGYVEGRNVRYEYRFADGFLERLPALASSLVRLNPQVIVSAPVSANLAIRNATRTIPIVMASGADPVSFGLVANLSEPGGNVTGLMNFADEIAAKQLDLMRELLPQLSRVAVLVNVANPLYLPRWRETQAAAAKVSIGLVRVELRGPEELEQAFARFTHAGAEALLVPLDTTFATFRGRIAELAARSRLPAIFSNRLSVEAGGLIGYGPDPVENYRRAATFVDKILKGAKPADLPIERPTKIELVINLKTAAALGLEVPPALLARADHVIK